MATLPDEQLARLQEIADELRGLAPDFAPSPKQPIVAGPQGTLAGPAKPAGELIQEALSLGAFPLSNPAFRELRSKLLVEKRYLRADNGVSDDCPQNHCPRFFSFVEAARCLAPECCGNDWPEACRTIAAFIESTVEHRAGSARHVQKGEIVADDSRSCSEPVGELCAEITANTEQDRRAFELEWWRLCGAPQDLGYEKAKQWATADQAKRDTAKVAWQENHRKHLSALLANRRKGLLSAGFTPAEIDDVDQGRGFVPNDDKRWDAFNEVWNQYVCEQKTVMKMLGVAPESASGHSEAQVSIGTSAAKPKTDEGTGGADNWITVSQAGTISGVNKGAVSRAAKAGEIVTNGKSGRALRLAAGSFAQWALKCSPANGSATPSPAEIEERAKEARRNRGAIDND